MCSSSWESQRKEWQPSEVARLPFRTAIGCSSRAQVAADALLAKQRTRASWRSHAPAVIEENDVCSRTHRVSCVLRRGCTQNRGHTCPSPIETDSGLLQQHGKDMWAVSPSGEEARRCPSETSMERRKWSHHKEREDPGLLSVTWQHPGLWGPSREDQGSCRARC